MKHWPRVHVGKSSKFRIKIFKIATLDYGNGDQYLY